MGPNTAQKSCAFLIKDESKNKGKLLKALRHGPRASFCADFLPSFVGAISMLLKCSFWEERVQQKAGLPHPG